MQSILTTTHKIAAFIPQDQFAATIEPVIRTEEFFSRLEKQLANCPKLGETYGMKEHPAILHYFYEDTDLYICEFDGHNVMYRFTILNGNKPYSEWGYINPSEILSIPVTKIDYYLTEQSIEAAWYRKHPNHFTKPASLEKQRLYAPALRRVYFTTRSLPCCYQFSAARNPVIPTKRKPEIICYTITTTNLMCICREMT